MASGPTVLRYKGTVKQLQGVIMRVLPFFVYGTLRAGEPNHGIVRRHLILSEGGSVGDYALYDNLFFPYAVASEGNTVIGDILHVGSDDYLTVLAALDLLEGVEVGHYVRNVVTVLTENDEEVQCWMYTAGPAVYAEIMQGRFDLIEGGDWIKHYEKRQYGED